MQEKKFLITFKSRLFSVKNLDQIPTREPTPEPATEPTTYKKSKLKLQQEFFNQIAASKKDINEEIFWNCLKYQSSSFLAKDLIRAKKVKNEQLVNNFNDELIDLRNAINKMKMKTQIK